MQYILILTEKYFSNFKCKNTFFKAMKHKSNFHTFTTPLLSTHSAKVAFPPNSFYVYMSKMVPKYWYSYLSKYFGYDPPLMTC